MLMKIKQTERYSVHHEHNLAGSYSQFVQWQQYSPSPDLQTDSPKKHRRSTISQSVRQTSTSTQTTTITSTSTTNITTTITTTTTTITTKQIPITAQNKTSQAARSTTQGVTIPCKPIHPSDSPTLVCLPITKSGWFTDL